MKLQIQMQSQIHFSQGNASHQSILRCLSECKCEEGELLGANIIFRCAAGCVHLLATGSCAHNGQANSVWVLSSAGIQSRLKIPANRTEQVGESYIEGLSAQTSAVQIAGIIIKLLSLLDLSHRVSDKTFSK